MAEKSESRNLARTAGAVSLATLISRVLGLIREMVLAKYFTVFATDAFFAAFRIPNLLRDLFAEGALSSAFIPTLTHYKQNKSPGEAWRLASLVLNALAIVLSILTLVFVFGARILVYVLVSGYREIPGKFDLTVELTQIMAPFLLLVALAAAAMGILNTHGRFFVPAVAPAFFNLCSILAGIFLAPYMPRFGQEPITAMAIGSLVGGATQLYVQLPSLYRCGFRYLRIVDWKDPGLRRIMTLMLPAIFGLAATQINILIDNQLASYLGNGPVSWLNYAFRLMQLPIGIFGVSIATVHLATVSQKVASNDLEGVKSDLAEAVKLAAFLNIPATLGMICLRYPIVQLLYQRGNFTAEHTIRTGDALLFYSLGILAYSLVKIVTPTFYALGDTKTPVKLAALVIAFKLGINLALIKPLGFLGLALGTALASALNTALLFWALNRKIGSLSGHGVAKALFKITIASILMGLLAIVFLNRFSLLIGAEHTMGRVWSMGATILLSIAALMGISYVLKIEQANELIQFVKRRFRRS